MAKSFPPVRISSFAPPLTFSMPNKVSKAVASFVFCTSFPTVFKLIVSFVPFAAVI